MIQATLQLYRECAVEAWGALVRSPLALVALFAASPLMSLAAVPVGQIPVLGGFILGALQAAVIGWYLSLLAVALSGRRRVALSDLTGNAGALFGEVISVLFVFFLAELVLSLVAPGIGGALGLSGSGLTLIFTLIGGLVFNPAPEMVYQERSQSTDLLSDAVRFMQANWPEWLAAHLPAALFMGVWGALIGGDPARVALEMVQMFGPWFGFIHIFQFVVMDLTPKGLALGGTLLVFVHGFLLFRGSLYRRLSRSSRRGREWSARTG